MRFKSRVEEGALLRGVISVIPSPVVTQAIAGAGADFIMIDCEHGPIGPETLHAMIAATAGTECAPLVRVPQIDAGAVKLALDMGAEGIFFPLVKTTADAERCVSLVRYPPEGERGWGPFVGHSRHGVSLEAYASECGPQVACCLLIETAEAVDAIEAILAVPGIDLAVVAQFDLSSALGVLGQFDAPVMVEAVRRIEAAAERRGIPLGAAALTREQSVRLIAAGYRLLFNGFDVLMLERQVAEFGDWS
jgi:4-hydroxy-2-oxoheptanedioate aldolase